MANVTGFSSISSLRDPGTVVKGEDLWLSAPDVEALCRRQTDVGRALISGTEVSPNKQSGFFF